ncbi:hypothetical protein LCGC14_0346070 [marine sediment metagenome]|uniref:Uncharacterized protein n=1 Tax=marine sediment metagenome TaxID=412755 RepID=A0A0F9TC76_9ZZZZ
MDANQKKLLAETEGIIDQIKKQHWLNVHFRAFELANNAWKEHIRANARVGAKEVDSPAGAVLDDRLN